MQNSLYKASKWIHNAHGLTAVTGGKLQKQQTHDQKKISLFHYHMQENHRQDKIQSVSMFHACVSYKTQMEEDKCLILLDPV